MKRNDFADLNGIIDEKTKQKIDPKQAEKLKSQLADIDLKKVLDVFSSLDPNVVKSKLKNLDLKNFDPEKLKNNPELYKKIKKD